MQLGLIGLGRMGGNIARRLMQNKHEIVAFDHNPKTIAALDGATGVQSLKELVSKLKPPRAVWVMVPAGAPTESTVQALGGLLDAGDTVLDGGNSFFKDDVRRAQMMAQRGIDYVDVGTSGGVWGFERGYCMMIGGKKEVVQRLDPIFAALAPGEGSIPKTPHREGRDPRGE
jgi:6-phosphogluconate dehydrogenase